MERVRAKFNGSQLLLGLVCEAKDNFANVIVKLYDVYKVDESSPENESFSNSIPCGSVELRITGSAASEFFEKLAGKHVCADFTVAD